VSDECYKEAARKLNKGKRGRIEENIGRRRNNLV